MAEWNLKYETGFTIPKKEENYVLKTINDFVELNSKEIQILEMILNKGKSNESFNIR